MLNKQQLPDFHSKINAKITASYNVVILPFMPTKMKYRKDCNWYVRKTKAVL